jgi:hypothetical protein
MEDSDDINLGPRPSRPERIRTWEALVTADQAFVHSRIGLRGTGQTLPVAALG